MITNLLGKRINSCHSNILRNSSWSSYSTAGNSMKQIESISLIYLYLISLFSVSNAQQGISTYPNSSSSNPWNVLFRYELQFDDGQGKFGASLNVGSTNSSIKISAPWTVGFTYPFTVSSSSTTQPIVLEKLSAKYRFYTPNNGSFTFGFNSVDDATLIGATRSVLFNFTGVYDTTTDPALAQQIRSFLINGPPVMYWRISPDYRNRDATLDNVPTVPFLTSIVQPQLPIRKAPTDNFAASMGTLKNNGDKAGNLSKGALIGIIVAACIGVFALIGIYLYQRNRKIRIQKDLAENPSYGIKDDLI